MFVPSPHYTSHSTCHKTNDENRAVAVAVEAESHAGPGHRHDAGPIRNGLFEAN
jgi:hypothetical protein